MDGRRRLFDYLLPFQIIAYMVLCIVSVVLFVLPLTIAAAIGLIAERVAKEPVSML